MKKMVLVFSVLFFVLTMVSAGTSSAQCLSNADCLYPAFFCAKVPGDCMGIGECLPKPQACPPYIDPVCGCDGMTYGNDCDAAMSGTNVAHKGSCLPPEDCGECTSNEDCPDGTICNANTLCLISCSCPMCDVCAGHCVPKTQGCTSNGECSATDFCLKVPGNCLGQGTCEPKPDVCPLYFDPVCGCNGVTYGNDCEAARAGVNVAHKGVCQGDPCGSNRDCSAPDLYCANGPGDCLGAGTCEPRPDVCPLYFDPVCGCDGMTYGNDCEAALAGVNVDFAGPCPPPCPIPQVKIRGGGQKPTTTDLQIQLECTVISGCIVDFSASSITVQPCTELVCNLKSGNGPDPSSAELNGVSVNPDMILPIKVCEGQKLFLENSGNGGKDKDRITIKISAP